MRSRKHKTLCQSTETLEIREVKAAAITAALSASGVLTVTGTDSQDVIHVDSSSSGVAVTRYAVLPGGPGGAPIEVPIGNIPISVGGRLQPGVPRNQVRPIVINAAKGDDRITLNTDIRSSVSGGDGNDILIGGKGDDFLYGGRGNDLLYGKDGIDFLYGDDGDDRLYGGKGDDHLYGNNHNDP